MNIAQQIVNGLVLGSGYACIALGWTILLGVARLVNFAHGQLYMLGAFVTWYAMTKLGMPYPVAILAAIVVLAVLGALMQSAMMGLVMTQNLTSLMIVTLGLGYVLQGGSALIFGGNPQTLPGTLSRAKVDLGSLWFTWQDVLVLVATLVLYGAVWLFTQRTRFGSVIRAVAEDPKAGRTIRYQRQDRLSPRLRVRMLGGRARRGLGGAALADPDQHGLQRGHHDLRGGRARRHRLDRRRADRGSWPWPVHRLLRCLRGAGLHDGGGVRAAVDAAGGPAGGIGNQMTAIEHAFVDARCRCCAVAVVVAR